MVFGGFFAVLRYLANFFAVLRCSEPPNVPLIDENTAEVMFRMIKTRNGRANRLNQSKRDLKNVCQSGKERFLTSISRAKRNRENVRLYLASYLSHTVLIDSVNE